MEASSRTKSPRMLRPMVVTSNLLVAVVAILAIFAGVAIILDSSWIQKINEMQDLKVKDLSKIRSFGSTEPTDSKGKRTDIRRHKLELWSKVPLSTGETGKVLEESSDALAGKPTSRGWRNFPYVLIAVASLTLLTTSVGLLAIQREPLSLTLTLTLLVAILLILQSFALAVLLLPLEDMSQPNQHTAVKQRPETMTIFLSLLECVIPVLVFNCALSLIVLILCFVQFFMHRHNTQSPFKILHPI